MALAAKLCLPGVALAYLTGGTWIETGAETGSAPFTKIEVFADASTTLTDVVLYGLSAPGWTNTLVNPQYSVAQGPYTGSVSFTWQFPDPGDQYREIEYLVWNGDYLEQPTAPGFQSKRLVCATRHWVMGILFRRRSSGFLRESITFQFPRPPAPHRAAPGHRIAGVVRAEAEMQARS